MIEAGGGPNTSGRNPSFNETVKAAGSRQNVMVCLRPGDLSGYYRRTFREGLKFLSLWTESRM